MKPYFILTVILVLIMVILPLAVKFFPEKNSSKKQVNYDSVNISISSFEDKNDIEDLQQ